MIGLLSNIANGVFLSLLVGIPVMGYIKKVKVYDAFIEGGKEGFTLVIKLIPYLVAMLTAIGMLRASGAFDLMARILSPVLHYFHIPASVVPLMLMRPFSGSASNAILADVVQHTGGNSFDAFLAATMMGSTETTFYVIAVYFGAVGIRQTRYAAQVGLLADAAGLIASIIICRLLF